MPSRWDIWSSKKMWGFRIAKTVLFSQPPRKKPSLTRSPHDFNDLMARAYAGALRAVTMETNKRRAYAASSFARASSRS